LSIFSISESPSIAKEIADSSSCSLASEKLGAASSCFRRQLNTSATVNWRNWWLKGELRIFNWELGM